MHVGGFNLGITHRKSDWEHESFFYERGRMAGDIVQRRDKALALHMADPN